MQIPQLDNVTCLYDFGQKSNLSGVGDLSGNMHNGTLINFAGDSCEYYMCPRHGEVMKGNGHDAIINLNASNLVAANASLLFLFRLIDTDLQFLFTSGASSSYSTVTFDTNKLQFQNALGAGNSIITNSTWNDTRWHVGVVVRDVILANCEIWVDGQLQATVAGGNFIDSNDDILFGTDKGASAYGGVLKLFILWNAALTPVEIHDFSRKLLENFHAPAPEATHAQPETNLNNGLVGHWQVGDDATTVIDLSGEGNNLTWNGVPLLRHANLATNNKIIQSREFTGAVTKEYLTYAIGGGDALDFGGAHTLIARVNLDAIGDYGFIGKTTGNAATDISSMITISATFITFQIGDGVNSASLVATYAIAAGQYYDIACVWDGTIGPDNMKMYINGTLHKTGSQNTVASLKSCVGSNLALGRYPNHDGWYQDGLIPESWVYNRALGERDIRALISKQQVVFDFKNGLGDWTSGSATKRYFVNAEGNLKFTNTTTTFRGITYPFSFTDGEIEIKARNLINNTSQLAFCFMMNQGGNIETTTYNGYSISLRRNGAPFHRLTHTNAITAIDDNNILGIDNSWHIWTIRKFSTSFEVYFDNVLALSGVDATWTTSEKFGIRSLNNLGWEAGYVKITPF